MINFPRELMKCFIVVILHSLWWVRSLHIHFITVRGFPDSSVGKESTEIKWSESLSVVSDSLWPNRLYSPWNSPGQNMGVGSLSLLQGIFPIQGLNPGLPHCRQILCQLSHKGSPRILEWVAYSLLQRIFLTQESNRGLLHCRRILYQLSYQKSPNWGYGEQ